VGTLGVACGKLCCNNRGSGGRVKHESIVVGTIR